MVDPVGRVIHYNGRVLRGIRRRFADDVPAMLACAARDHWFDHGLVATWQTGLSTTEFPVILEHRRIPFVTVRSEWSAEALRRAALCYLELSVALIRSGYCLKDAHPWNVLFDGPTPKMTDFGSIRPMAELNWAGWLGEFHRYFLAPLLMFARGKAALARAMLREHIVGVGLWLIEHSPESLLPGGFTPATLVQDSAEDGFARLHDLIGGLRFPHGPTIWTDYAQPDPGSAPDALRAKDRLVQELVKRLQFASAIDLGANRGLHATMCADTGAAVVACDIDETCLDGMFTNSERSARSVLPLYLDVVWPAGPGGAFQTILSAPERLRCDLVLALALVHHVCVRAQFPVATFAEAVAAFTRRAAIVEFVPADDWHVAQWGVTPPAGYSLDGMQGALARLFNRVERIPSEPAPRQIFFCEGKR